MSTSRRELSRRLNSEGKAEIILRISVCRGLQPRIHTGLYVNPTRLRGGVFVRPRSSREEAVEIRCLEASLTQMEQYLLQLCETTPREQLSRSVIEDALSRHNHPELYAAPQAMDTFHALFEEYIGSQSFSESMRKNSKVMAHSFERFELYQIASARRKEGFDLNTLSDKELKEFEEFLKTEHLHFRRYPEIYERHPPGANRRPHSPGPKGSNTVAGILKRLRAFYRWLNDTGVCANNPFRRFHIKAEVYGTPYYLTAQERDCIANFDFGDNKRLATQRDIFIFHCYVGCRVSDLMRLKPSNIIDGALEYIAGKTRQERGERLRVPLHPRAMAIVKRYESTSERLFPFISPQRYNYAIKEIFTACEITRRVTVLNSTTRTEEQLPLNELASSHIARRTFIGLLYKKVKDPNLIGKLSGHKEGSRAFVRYRDIDEETKRETINLL